jgi:hypothetical protein
MFEKRLNCSSNSKIIQNPTKKVQETIKKKPYLVWLSKRDIDSLLFYLAVMDPDYNMEKDLELNVSKYYDLYNDIVTLLGNTTKASLQEYKVVLNELEIKDKLATPDQLRVLGKRFQNNHAERELSDITIQELLAWMENPRQ